MRFSKVLVSLFLMFGVATSHALVDGIEVGNGGGQAHTFFVKNALNLIEAMQDPSILPLLANLKIDPSLIKKSFNPSKVTVTSEGLVDNLGNAVDALVVKQGTGKIIVINNHTWERFQLANLDVSSLVLKEMLRLTGYNQGNQAIEDALIISKALQPVLGVQEKNIKPKTEAEVRSCQTAIAADFRKAIEGYELEIPVDPSERTYDRVKTLILSSDLPVNKIVADYCNNTHSCMFSIAQDTSQLVVGASAQKIEARNLNFYSLEARNIIYPAIEKVLLTPHVYLERSIDKAIRQHCQVNPSDLYF